MSMDDKSATARADRWLIPDLKIRKKCFLFQKREEKEDDNKRK